VAIALATEYELTYMSSTSHSLTAMIDKNAYFFLLAIWVISIVMVNPIGDFPLNDDWQYAYPVKQIIEEGRFEMQGYFAPNIVLQVGWGALICSITGKFDFTILRFSTLILAIPGSFIFYRITQILGCTSRQSLTGSIVFLSTPLYFNLSFSFMTDVPFVVIMLLGVLCYLHFLNQQKSRWLLLAALFSIAAFLIRQPGILLLPIMGIWGVWENRTSIKSWSLFGFLLLLGVSAYFIYEGAGKSMLGIADNFVPVSGLYFQEVLEQPVGFLLELSKKGIKSWIYAGFFCLPLIPFLWVKIQRLILGHKGIAFGLLVFNLLLLFYLHHIDKVFPFGGNILYNFGLGPELLVDTYTLQLPNTPQLSPLVFYALNLVSQFSASVLCWLIGSSWRQQSKLQQRFFGFLILLNLLYLPAMSITSFFDRYLLLTIASAMLLLLPQLDIKSRFQQFLPLILIGLFSLIATRDYLSWNRAKASAFHWLLENEVLITQMDAGYEYNGFYNYHHPRAEKEGQSYWWVNDDQYIISFGPVPGYNSLQQFPYRRWLWVGRKDHIWVLKEQLQ
jgi:hypothetical protein